MTQAGKWLPIVSLMLVMLLIQFIGPELFRYETRLITVDLQLWRLLTGHWVHANWIHYLMNMTGFFLCIALTGVVWTIWQWGWRILLLSLGISASFYLGHPDIGWYVGFSGVLFGLYVLAAVSSLHQQFYMSLILLLVIAGKIILEQWSSVNITTGDLIGVPVMVDAHLYGILIALVLVFVQILVKKTLQTEVKDSGSI
ncbi:MAG: rhombosortase [Gammaproteobacteria bacterium]|nr:rhombosortase [Gammaproteobacteria bacterium]